MRKPQLEDLYVALVHTISQSEKGEIVVPCEQYAGKSYELTFDFRNAEAGGTELVIRIKRPN